MLTSTKIYAGELVFVGPTGGIVGSIGGAGGQLSLSGFTGAPTGPTGPTGAVGPSGVDGISSGLLVFLDTAGGSYSGTAITGTVEELPNQTAQTTITGTLNLNDDLKVATFMTGAGFLNTNVISGGIWDFNLYSTAAVGAYKYYTKVFWVDAVNMIRWT